MIMDIRLNILRADVLGKVHEIAGLFVCGVADLHQIYTNSALNRQKNLRSHLWAEIFRLVVLLVATHFPNILSIISSTHSGSSMVYTFFSSR